MKNNCSSFLHLLLIHTKRFAGIVIVGLLLTAQGSPAAAKAEGVLPKSLRGLNVLFPKQAKVSKKERRKDTEARENGKEGKDEAKQGQSAVLKELRSVTSVKKANVRDEKGQTTLMHAAARDSRLAVCWLVAKGADVTLKDKDGKTALDYAKSIPTRELLRICAEEREPLDPQTLERYKKTEAEVIRGWLQGSAQFVSLVDRYVKAGVDVKQACNGRQVLAKVGIQPESVAYLVRHGCDVNARNNDGTPVIGLQTPIDSIRLMLALGLKLDLANPADKKAAFVALVALDDVKEVKKWLKEEAELTKQTNLMDMAYTYTILKNFRDFIYDGIAPGNVLGVARSGAMVKELVAVGVDPKADNSHSFSSSLMAAVWSHQPASVVQALIESGSEADKQEGCVPVLDYAQDGKTAELLIAAGQDAAAQDSWGDTPLDRAVREYRPDVVQVLMKHGAKPDAGKIPTLQQAFFNPLDNVDPSGGWMLTDRGLSSTYRERLSRRSKLPDIIKTLLAAGAKVDAETWNAAISNMMLSECRDYPTEALGASCAEIIDALSASGVEPPADVLLKMRTYGIDDEVLTQVIGKLLDAGADPKSTNDEQETLLMTLGKASPKIAQLLIDKGVDVKAVNKEGQTALFMAENPEILELLVKAGLDINAKDKEGRTPLMCNLSSAGGPEKMFKAAVAAGADVKATANNGQNLLIAAASTGLESIVRPLLDAGLDPNAADKNGKTPLAAAANSWNDSSLKVMDMLVKAGADPQVKDKLGRSLFHYAAEDFEHGAEKVRFLVNAGLDAHENGHHGLSNMGLFLQFDNRVPPETAIELLKAGADLNKVGAGVIRTFERYPNFKKILDEYRKPKS